MVTNNLKKGVRCIMFSELSSFVKQLNHGDPKLAEKFASNPRIRSISSYSSNSIFYFPTIVSNQVTPEEQGMIMKMLERQYASFVVACINLLPPFEIKAGDIDAVSRFLQQLHQNMGTAGSDIGKAIGNWAVRQFQSAAGISESAAPVTETDIEETRQFLKECWEQSLKTNQNFIKLVEETVPLYEMFNESPIDPKIRVIQEQFIKTREELDEWGFLGEATANMFDTTEDLSDVSDEELAPMDESGNVKGAIDKIKFSLESVPSNRILSCNSLVRLQKYENKLNGLKNKYAKYLTRYKRKVKENAENGTKQTLHIQFNGMDISNPKAFMHQYGGYIKIINKRLQLVDKRREELRSRKGISESSEGEGLLQMDFDAMDFCLETIDKLLSAPDTEVFYLTEAISEEEKARRARQSADRARRDAERAEQQAKRSQDQARTAREKAKEEKERANEEREKRREAEQKANDEREKRQAAEDELRRSRDQGRDSNPFRNGPFTQQDVQKANEVMPLFLQAEIQFKFKETGDVIKRGIIIGVKAYTHLAPANELVDDIYQCVINRRPLLKFIKFITGEERSLADLLFGIKELKSDAAARSDTGKWKSAFRQRRRWSKISNIFLLKNYTPNGTLVMTLSEANYLKDHYGIDILSGDTVSYIMEHDFLLGFVVIDQSNEVVYVAFDGVPTGVQQYTYAMLERETRESDRQMRDLYRAIAASR